MKPKKSKQTLKPCPFGCDSKPAHANYGTAGFHVECPECGARGPWGEDRKEASLLWNNNRHADKTVWASGANAGLEMGLAMVNRHIIRFCEEMGFDLDRANQSLDSAAKNKTKRKG